MSSRKSKTEDKKRPREESESESESEHEQAGKGKDKDKDEHKKKNKKPKYDSYVAASVPKKPATDFKSKAPVIPVSRTDWSTVRRHAEIKGGVVDIRDVCVFDKADPTNPRKNRVGLVELAKKEHMTDEGKTWEITGRVVDNNTGRELTVFHGPQTAESCKLGPLGNLDDKKNPYKGGNISGASARDLKGAVRSMVFRGWPGGPTYIERHCKPDKMEPEEVKATDDRGYDKDWADICQAYQELNRHLARCVLCLCQPSPAGSPANPVAFSPVATAIALATGGRAGATWATMTPEEREKAVDNFISSKSATVEYPNPAGADKPAIVVPLTHGIVSTTAVPKNKDDELGPHVGRDINDKGAFSLYVSGKIAYATTTGRGAPAIPDGSWESESVRKHFEDLGVEYRAQDVYYMVNQQVAPDRWAYKPVEIKEPFLDEGPFRVEAPIRFYLSLAPNFKSATGMVVRAQIAGPVTVFGKVEVERSSGVATVDKDGEY